MAGKGPPKTPTSILKLRGSWRGDVRPDQEPLAAFEHECPDHLDDYARAYWKKSMPILLKYGLMTEPDLEFELLCAAYGSWRMDYDFIRKMGGLPVYKDDAGIMRENPAIKSEAKKWEQLRRAMADFGCNPSARAGIAIKGIRNEKPTGKDRFFDKKLS